MKDGCMTVTVKCPLKNNSPELKRGFDHTHIVIYDFLAIQFWHWAISAISDFSFGVEICLQLGMH